MVIGHLTVPLARMEALRLVITIRGLREDSNLLYLSATFERFCEGNFVSVF